MFLILKIDPDTAELDDDFIHYRAARCAAEFFAGAAPKLSKIGSAPEKRIVSWRGYPYSNAANLVHDVLNDFLAGGFAIISDKALKQPRE